MLSPKERFLKSPHAKSHYDLCATEGFQAAVEAAFAQTSMEFAFMERNDIPGFILGAKTFMEFLMHLADAPKPPTTIRDPYNLKHE